MGRSYSPSAGKAISSTSAGAYNNYYKADKDAKGNPIGYATATSAISEALDKAGLPESWLKPTLELVARESSFNPQAANAKSSAKGLFQFLNATRANYGGDKVNWNDPKQQAIAGIKYIKDRYGTPEQALEFWDQNQHY